MICPKCGKDENIKFFVRHQSINEDDDSQVANCLTILHADPECGHNESVMLEHILDIVFPNWSEVQKINEQLNEIENNMAGMAALGQMFTGMIDSEAPIETEGEVIDDVPAIEGEVEESIEDLIQEEEVEEEIEEAVIDNVEVERE